MKSEREKPQGEVWEQHDGEDATAYEAARIYCALGGKRTYAEVARQTGRHVSTIQRYARRYGWKERARAYDAHVREARQPQQQEPPEPQPPQEPHGSPVAEVRRWLQRLREGRECEWKVSQELLARVREMLAAPLDETRWTPKDVATYSALAAQLLRQAASEVIEHTGDDQGEEILVRVVYEEQREPV